MEEQREGTWGKEHGLTGKEGQEPEQVGRGSVPAKVGPALQAWEVSSANSRWTRVVLETSSTSSRDSRVTGAVAC